MNQHEQEVLMRTYKQLDQEQRYQIYAYRKVGKSQGEIAHEIGVHPSTISRELKRNTGNRGYRPKQAHERALFRRQQADKALKMVPEVIDFVEAKLLEDWSPEQISGIMKKEGGPWVSHERIYQHIWTDKQQGGTLYQHLRGSRKKRKKRYGTKESRGQIKNRVMIDQRPQEVDEKSRIGDWEIDTVIGANHKGALVTIVERVSKYTLIGNVPQKQAGLVSDLTIKLMSPYQKKVQTITADNGKEFAEHQRITQKLKAQVFFAHPYHSWERGLNENTNGLIRQYFPKGTSLEMVPDRKIKWVMDRLNHRPRKTLGFNTPYSVFHGTVP